MNNCMIYLETLGTLPGSVILSIGAVFFDPNLPAERCVGHELYMVVSQSSCKGLGLHTSQSALDWWGKQSAEARQVLTQAEGEDALPLRVALQGLKQFLGTGTKVWSNGANFDQPLLDVAYDRVDISLPWKYYNSRCYRTLVNLHANPKDLWPATVCAHNALEDAKWQAKHMVAVAQDLGLKL